MSVEGVRVSDKCPRPHDHTVDLGNDEGPRPFFGCPNVLCDPFHNLLERVRRKAVLPQWLGILRLNGPHDKVGFDIS
jgi:hypothetical protein